MICYFSDASIKEEDELFIIKHTKHRLISYHYKSAVFKFIDVCLRNDLAKDISFLVDSGAYSIWNSGKPPLQVEVYEEFCHDVIKRCKNQFKTLEFINLDVIPGERNKPVTIDHIEYAQKKSWENYIYLNKSVPNMLPVFHQGDGFEYLKMIEDITLRYCISPANDKSTPQKLFWCNDVFSRINEEAKPHGLGFSSSEVAKCNDWYSFDAATHALRAAFGTVVYYYGKQMMDIVFSDKRGPSDTGSHFFCFTKAERDIIEQSVESIGEGFTIDSLINDGKRRRLANIYYMAKFYNEFKPNKQIIQESLF